MQNPQTKAKITKVYKQIHSAMFSKAKYLSDHFQYHSAIFISQTCGQEPGYRLSLVPFSKKNLRETPLGIN